MSLWLFYFVYVTVAILSYGYLVTWRFCIWRFCNMAVLYVAVLYPHRMLGKGYRGPYLPIIPPMFAI